MSARRPRIAFAFRYGPAEHAELFHALPALLAALGREAEVHYFGLRSACPPSVALPPELCVHELPWRVHRRSPRDKWLKTLFWIALVPGIARRCRRMGMDALYFDETIPLTAGLALRHFGPRVALTVADIFVDVYAERSAAVRGLRPWLQAADERAWRKLPLIFTRARATRDYLIERGVRPEAVHPVYDPCDFSRYHPGDRAAARRKWGYGDSEIVLVHHGILHPNKGNDWILEALAPIWPRHPELQFLLIGDGPEMPRLRRMVLENGWGDRVRLTGWLPRPEDVCEALNAADIGLVMRRGARSDDFHLTGALVHNMACGLPILAARLGGVSEVVREGEHGWLFSPSDPAEFVKKLETAIANPQQRADFGRRAHETARAVLDRARRSRHRDAAVETGAGGAGLIRRGRASERRRMKSVSMAIILCGGAGTRIRARYPDRPKALIPVAGRPFIEWQLAALAAAGIRRVVLAAGVMAEALAAWRDAWRERAGPNAPDVRIAIEPRPLGTGGALRFAAGAIEGEIVLALNGDSLAPNLDFQALEEEGGKFSKAWKKIALRFPSLGKEEAAGFQTLETRGAAIAVTPVESAARFGSVVVEDDGWVSAFREKAGSLGGWINAGVYLFETAFVRAWPAGFAFSLERDVFPAMAAAGALRAAKVAPPLLDLGTPEGLAEMERTIAAQ